MLQGRLENNDTEEVHPRRQRDQARPCERLEWDHFGTTTSDFAFALRRLMHHDAPVAVDGDGCRPGNQERMDARGTGSADIGASELCVLSSFYFSQCRNTGPSNATISLPNGGHGGIRYSTSTCISYDWDLGLVLHILSKRSLQQRIHETTTGC